VPEEQKERLQKVLAHAGVASRREAENLIRQGRVAVNGDVVTQMGTKVDPVHDEILVDGMRVQPTRSWTYIMLNKPRGVLSTMEDSRGRRSLGDLLEAPMRLFPVGRLDAASEGLILLTNDGELANLLTHPRYQHEKEYQVLVNGHPSKKVLAAWERGVILDGEQTAPAKVDLISQEKGSTLLRIVMREGRKRQIRNVASLLGHPVQELKRVRLGTLQLGTLEPGQWRYLTRKEIGELRALRRGPAKARAKKPGRGGHGY
jgi:23S rRNA pseudouridine2605 synthase